MRRIAALALIIAGLAGGAPAAAQTLKLTGLGPAPVELDRAAIEKLGLSEAKDTREVTAGGVSQKQETVYSGVDLPRLLDAYGLDRLDRYAVRSASIVIVARDAYKASFSWGELFNGPNGRQVLLILKENGAPLPERAGAFSLRSLSDTRPGPRHVRDVGEIRVILN